jgi:outer membrane protein assembly factor BamB
MRGSRLFLGVVVAVALAGGAIAIAGPDHDRFARERAADDVPGHPPPASGSLRVSLGPAVPPDVAAARADWPLPNGDYANRRATTTAKISATNVGKLGVAWYLKLPSPGYWGSAAGGTLIAGDTVYFQDLRSNVYALDLTTGKERWVNPLNQAAFGPNGPALGYGKVYVHDGDHSVAAIDAKTGTTAWRSSLGGPTGQQQPVVYAGRVYTGIAAGAKAHGPPGAVKTHLLIAGSSGFAYALDAADGDLLWDFQTVQKGFWGNPNLNAGGGIWMPAAIDTATGTTYWATGNPVPAPGTRDEPNARSRPGPNLYTDTLLALDGRSGKLLWHNQLVPHDMFHHDLQNPPVLTEARGRKLVIASGKMGVVYAVDRETGALVWKRPVGTHRNDELKTLPLGKAVTVYPGFWGGVETPLALADGTIYALTENLPTPYTATAWNAKDGHEAVEHLEGRTSYAKGTSELDAIDVATGRIKWRHAFPTVGFGAATVVNDLVLTATYDGTIYALARAGGKVLWRFHAPGGIVSWPAVAGDTIVWPVGLGRDPGVLALRLGAHGPTEAPRARPERSGK